MVTRNVTNGNTGGVLKSPFYAIRKKCEVSEKQNTKVTLQLRFFSAYIFNEIGILLRNLYYHLCFLIHFYPHFTVLGHEWI